MPIFIEHRRVFRVLPIMISQTNGIAQRIYLPFAFMQFLNHMLCMVGFPIAAQRPVVEGIGIRVYQDTFSLSVDKSCHHQLQVLIFLHQRQIGPYLRWRVAQPHGIYITCNDESIWSAILHSISDSSVKRIGKTVLEHPTQLLVLYFRLCFFNSSIYCLRNEAPFACRRTQRNISLVESPGWR